MGTGKRVVGNSVIMYVQLILNVLIGLVSVRLILRALGQSDYGVYDVIGGIVGLMNFISSSLAQSSMRFISVSMGRGNEGETAKVFNSCFWLHFAIAGLLTVILEVVGLFLFKGFLNIPPDRIHVAKVIYHCMVVSLFLRVNISPMSALIGSFEEFWYVAVVSITDSLLKLGIAVFITYTVGDRLLLYGFLMMCMSFINLFLYFGYLKIRHKDVVRITNPDLSGIRKIVGFAGWTFLDTFSSVVNRQGYSIMLNKFFGPIMNSAFALARQLEGHMFSVSAAVVNAMKPQVMKSHGAGDDSRMFRLSMTAGKFGFYMMSLIVIPLIVMMSEVLDLWLGIYPPETVTFARLLMAACLIEQLTKGLVHANQAIGNIKWFSIIVSSMRILALPVSIAALIMGSEAYVAILIFLIFETMGSICRVLILAKISDFKPLYFVRDVLAQVLPPSVFALVFCYFFYHLSGGILWMCITVIATFFVMVGVVLFVGLTREEKYFIMSLFNAAKTKIRNH